MNVDAVARLGRRHQAGMAIRREVLGDAHVDRTQAATTPFTADFQDLITRYAWGEIWSRSGLDRRIRSLITVAMLASLGCEQELAMHVRAAQRSGVAREELSEVLLQVAVYAGCPPRQPRFRRRTGGARCGIGAGLVTARFQTSGASAGEAQDRSSEHLQSLARGPAVLRRRPSRPDHMGEGVHTN